MSGGPSAATGRASPPRRVRLVPVILCGGSGPGLWPVARDDQPGPFWPLVSDRTLLQEAAGLAAPGRVATGAEADIVFTRPLVLCEGPLAPLVAMQLAAAGLPDPRIVLLPAWRGAAAAAAAAALLLTEDDPEAVLWMVVEDAMVVDADALLAALPLAVAAAVGLGRIILLGARSDGTGSTRGLIEPGPPVGPLPGVRRLAHLGARRPGAGRIAEAAALAADMTHDAFLRESGLYVSTAAAMLRGIGSGAPEVLRAATVAVARRGRGDAPGEAGDLLHLDATAFAACPEMALDTLVAASPAEAAVVPAETDLLELGGWAELWRISPKDPLGNVALGDVLLEGAEGCYVRSEETLTAVIGLKDAVVVSTGDAVLAMHRDLVPGPGAPGLGEAVRRLRRLGRPEVVAHRRSVRPWGSDEGLLSQEGYQVRRIHVRPGGAVGPLRHAHRGGHWVVVHGSALVTRDGVPALLHENEAIHLPLGCEYRLENPGRIALTLIEVRVGTYLGEDDLLAAPSRDGHAGA